MIQLGELDLTITLDGDEELLNVIDGDVDTSLFYYGDVYTSNKFSGEIDTSLHYDGELGIFIKVSSGGGGDPYTGQTVVTPTDYTQVLYTFGKTVGDNITINPIPSNYGKIGWNGAWLTVS